MLHIFFLQGHTAKECTRFTVVRKIVTVDTAVESPGKMVEEHRTKSRAT